MANYPLASSGFVGVVEMTGARVRRRDRHKKSPVLTAVPGVLDTLDYYGRARISRDACLDT